MHKYGLDISIGNIIGIQFEDILRRSYLRKLCHALCGWHAAKSVYLNSIYILLLFYVFCVVFIVCCTFIFVHIYFIYVQRTLLCEFSYYFPFDVDLNAWHVYSMRP